MDTWPNITSLNTRTYCGMFAWTMPNIKERLLWASTVVNCGFGPQTPGDLVRDYLEHKYPNRQRATTQQYHRIMKHRSFPCLAKRGRYADAVYVDLKSAYWSILSVVGWDVDYNPGSWLGVKSSNYDFPLPDNKPARSALVTAGLSSPVRVWDGSKFAWQTTNNKHINYGLWALVQDVLHGVALDMVRLGAVYIHTDGYILPGDRVGRALELIESWGLRGGVKAAGSAEVYGIGVYRVGEKKTKRQNAMPFKDHINVEPCDPDWLRKRMLFWSERQTRYAQK